jgi:nicotinate-nucleotide pyrophosphorylase (carboxylating)
MGMRRLIGAFDAGPPGREILDPLLRRVLKEDAAFDDRSTLPLERSREPVAARVLAREGGILAGVPVFRRVFEILARGSEGLEFAGLADGARFVAGDVVQEVRGRGGILLSGERTALNFLQRLSGIATRTAQCVAAAEGRIAICDTRKTTPGLRALEKYAVVVGGGRSHRWNLGDMVLLKENHLALAGGVGAAIAAVCADPRSRELPLTVEVRTFAEALEAAAAGVDRLLLDNMPAREMQRIAEALGGPGERPELEASGGVTTESIAEISRCGVDLVSLGALTHSVPAIDFSLLIDVEGLG